jgi:hypothetical protein
MIHIDSRRLTVAVLGTLIGLFGSSAAAAPILYNIEFTSTIGPTPTAGSFFYDATTETFTSFTVVSNGITYDLTSEAQTPFVVGTCDTGAPGSSGEDSFNFLLNPTCGAGNSASGWIDYPDEPRFLFLRYSLDVADMFSITSRNGSSTGVAAPTFAQGTFSVTQAVPEQSSISLMLFGGACLAYRFRSRQQNGTR